MVGGLWNTFARDRTPRVNDRVAGAQQIHCRPRWIWPQYSGNDLIHYGFR
jgi:hypothetical protein